MRSRLTPGLLIVAIVGLGITGTQTVSATSPQGGPVAFITVTPSDNLTIEGGQRVEVSGTGFPASSDVELSECANNNPLDVVCTNFVPSGAPAQTDASGNFGPIGVPAQGFVTDFNGFQTRTCPPSTCLIVAFVGGSQASHVITFGGSGSTTTTTSTTRPPHSTTTTFPVGPPARCNTPTGPVSGFVYLLALRFGIEPLVQVARLLCMFGL